MPVISIIVPVYKVEKYLDRCIQSILNQTFIDYELILIDDGSPDCCPQMCDDWAKRDERIVVIHKENGGLSSARNAGLAIARGKYVGFVDSDDWVDPKLFYYLYDLIVKTSSEISECSLFEIKEYGYKDISYIKEQITVLNQEEAYKRFFRVTDAGITYFAWGKLFLRECVENIVFPDGKLFEDIDFNFHVLTKAKKVVVSNLPLYYYFQSSDSISRRAFSKKDMDLLEIWNGIVQETAQKMPNMYEYAVLNRQRADFGLLCKSLKYGCKEDPEWYKDVQKQLTDQLKKNYIHLLKWKMPINRKILLTLICLDYRGINHIFSIYRRLRDA